MLKNAFYQYICNEMSVGGMKRGEAGEGVGKREKGSK